MCLKQNIAKSVLQTWKIMMNNTIKYLLDQDVLV